MTRLAFDWIAVIQYLLILAFSFYSLYFTIKWLTEIRGRYTPLVIAVKASHGFISLLWIAVYLYSLIRIIVGNPIDVNYYGMAVVRPVIVLTSIYLAISAKVRYYIAIHREVKCRQNQ